MSALFTALKALAAAVPGIMALINAFKPKPPPSQQDIAGKASSEINELESWKKSAKEQASK
jgi:hypothetical protein